MLGTGPRPISKVYDGIVPRRYGEQKKEVCGCAEMFTGQPISNTNEYCACVPSLTTAGGVTTHTIQRVITRTRGYTYLGIQEGR